MTAYALLLLAQTSIALVALGLAGYWLLKPFWVDHRPHFWLASPLAGVFTLGGSLGVLYFGFHLTFGWCLVLGFALNLAATIVSIWRELRRTSLSKTAIAFALALAVTGWTTVACNKTSIQRQEPTLVSMEGSDMFGYAIVADWLLDHPASERPQEHKPLEGLSFYNLDHECSRPVTFLLAAAAAEVRGTSGLFSFDWACGVVLAAAILGLAALFSSNCLIFASLLAGGIVCSWVTNTRTGFLGKAVAYPGALMLAAFFLATIDNPTRLRVLLVILFHCILGWTLNPIFPPTVLALLLPGYCLAVLWGYVARRWNDSSVGMWSNLCRPVLGAFLLASTTVPEFLIHRWIFGEFMGPQPPQDWVWVIPVSLDLEKPTGREFSEEKLARLIAGSALLLGSALFISLRQQRRMATALIGSTLLIPAMWVMGKFQLYLFQGILFPLSLAGTAVLAEHLSSRTASDPTLRWRPNLRLGLVSLLVIGMVLLRVPQFRSTADRFVISRHPLQIVQSEREMQSLREIIGTDDVDVALGHYADNHSVWAELATKGLSVRFRDPAWLVSVGAYAGPNPSYDLLAPKARYSLVERDSWTAAGTERWLGERLKLVEDGNDIALVSIKNPQGVNWPWFWRSAVAINDLPSTLVIGNGTPRTRSVLLQAEFRKGLPNESGGSFWYEFNGLKYQVQVSGDGKVAIPLSLAPGFNKVIFIEDKDLGNKPGTPPHQLHNLRILALEGG